MKRAAFTALCALLPACAASAQPPSPSLSPQRMGDFEDIDAILQSLDDQEVTTTIPADEPGTVIEEDSQLVQGGLAFGTTVPGSTVSLDGITVPVDRNGRFVLGFDRDHEPAAELSVVYPDGLTRSVTLDIGARDFPEEIIEGVPQNTVTPFSEEDLEHIRISTEKKNAARAEPSTGEAFWAEGFAWPATGRISGVFGSRRIYNGEPRRPHSGVDIARPLSVADPMEFIGTPVRAPSAGIVRLADPDMFFEGGLVLIDHGQNVESALMHLSAIDVEPGDMVEKGDLIGGVGMTGRATGPHLHWSLKWHDRLVDPQLVVGPMEAE